MQQCSACPWLLAAAVVVGQQKHFNRDNAILYLTHLLRKNAAAQAPNAEAMDVLGLDPGLPSRSALSTRNTCCSTASLTGSDTRGLWPFTDRVVGPYGLDWYLDTPTKTHWKYEL